MKLKVVVHNVPPSEGRGFWAEVPALPGCMTQGETWEELLTNVHEAIEGWLQTVPEAETASVQDQVIEIAV